MAESSEALSQAVPAKEGSKKVTCNKCNSIIQAGDPPRNLVLCPNCRSINCLRCGVVHEGMNCKTYKESLSNSLGPIESQQEPPVDQGTNSNFGLQHLPEKEYDKDPGREVICDREDCFRVFNVPTWATKFRCPFCLVEYTIPTDGERKCRKLTLYCELKELKQELKPDQPTSWKTKECWDNGVVSRNGHHEPTKSESRWKPQNEHQGSSPKLVEDGGSCGGSKDLEAAPEDEKFVECKKEGCDGMAIVDSDVCLFKCPRCAHFTCLKCQVIHESRTCEEYQRSLREPVPDIKQERRRPTEAKEPRQDSLKLQKHVACSDKKCKGQVFVDKHVQRFQCPVCKCNNCLTCDAIHPGTMTCEQYQSMFEDISSSAGSSDVHMDSEEPETVPSGEKLVRCCGVGCNGVAFMDCDAGTFECPSCKCNNCLKCNATHSMVSTCEQHRKYVGGGKPGDPLGSDVCMDPPTPVQEDSQQLPLHEQLVRCCAKGCEGMGVMDHDEVLFKCPLCSRYSCLKCKVIHENMTCEQYRRSLLEGPAADKTGGRDSKAKSAKLLDEMGSRVSAICANKNCRARVKFLSSDTNFTCPYCGRNTCLMCATQHPRSAPCPEHQKTYQQTSWAPSNSVPVEQVPLASTVDTGVAVLCRNLKCRQLYRIIASQELCTCPVCGTYKFAPGAKQAAAARLYPILDPLNSAQYDTPEKAPLAEAAVELEEPCAEQASPAGTEAVEIMVHCNDVNCVGRGLIDGRYQRQFLCPVCNRLNCLNCDGIHDGNACPQNRNKGLFSGIWDFLSGQPNKPPVPEGEREGQEVLVKCEDPRCPGTFLFNEHQEQYKCPQCRKINYIRYNITPPLVAGNQPEKKKKGQKFRQHFMPKSKEKQPERLRKFHCKDPACATEGEIHAGDESFFCPRCGKRSCIMCDVMHLGFTCRQYTIMKQDGRFQQSQELPKVVPGSRTYAEVTKRGKRDTGYQAWLA